MRISKKIIAVVLSVLMAISMMPLSVFAATTGVANGAELKAAVAAAQDGDVIEFTADNTTYPATTSGALVIPVDGKDITIDLKGHTQYFRVSGETAVTYPTDLFVLKNGAKLTVTDSVGGGAFYETYGGTSAAYMFNVLDTSELVINGGTFVVDAANFGGLIVFQNSDNASTTINGGTFLNHTGATGRRDTLVNAKRGSIEINDGTFTTDGTFAQVISTDTSLSELVINGGEFNGTFSISSKNNEFNGGTYLDYSGTTANTAIGAYLPADKVIDETTAQIVDADASAVAKIGNTLYTSLADAVAAATASSTIVLIKDVTVPSTIEVTSGAKFTIDMNGKSITSSARTFNIRNGGITLKNGTLTSNASAAVAVYGSTDSTASNYATFTLNSDATINAPNGYGAMIGANGNAAFGTVVTIKGTINSKYGVYVNGNVAQTDSKNAAKLYIYGTVTAGADFAAVYAAGYANWTIGTKSTPAVITGGSGIYTKSGNINVVNATITANGPKTAYKFNNNGADGTGDAVIIDSCGYPGNVPTVAIKAGTITSANGAAVASYAKQDDPLYPDAAFPRVDNVIPATSTAVFSSDVSELAADGYETVRDDEKGGYVIAKDEHSVAKVNGVKYDTFEAALAAISTVTTATHSKATDPTYEYKTYVANGEITLLQDCTTNGIIIGSGSDLTIDFNNKTLDITAKPVGSNGTETIGMQLLKDSDITFKDGTLTSTAASSEKIVRLIQNYSDLTLDNMTVSMKGNFYDQMTISNCNGEIAITDSTVSAPDFSWIGYDAEQSAESLRARAMSIGSFSSTAYPDVNVTITNSEINGYVNIDNSAEGATAELTLNNSTVNGNIVDKAMDGATVTNNESTVSGIPENYEWIDNGDGTSSLVEKEPVAEAKLAVGSKTELVFRINADAINATKIVVSAPDNTKENNTPVNTEYTNVSGEAYEIRVALAPAQIKENINVKIYNGSTLVDEYNYSIYQYCVDALVLYASNEDVTNLVKAFVNYAAASQKAVEWNYNSEKYAITDSELYEVASATPSSVAHFSAIDGATLTSVAVICRNTTAVRFKYTGTINSATVSGIDGAEVVVYDDAIDVVGIPADKINDAFTLTINGTEITYSVDSWNASALTHFAADNANHKLANALATYGAMADAYFA